MVPEVIFKHLYFNLYRLFVLLLKWICVKRVHLSQLTEIL